MGSEQQMGLNPMPFLLAEDLSAIGTMSLGAAIPILAAFGVVTANLPTQILSTQTEGFNTPAAMSSTTWLRDTLRHWQSQQLDFSGALIGYVGVDAIMTDLIQFLSQQSVPLLIVDPVMGDDGALYPGLTSDYVSHMRQLVKLADVITPNWTEAQLLLEVQFDEFPSEDDLKQVFEQLRLLVKPEAQLVVTGIPAQAGILTAYQSQADPVIQTVLTKKFSGHFYGSGDVFAAILSGALIKQCSLSEAVSLAVSGSSVALRQTASFDGQRRFGIQLSQLLAWLPRQQGVNTTFI